MNYQFESTLNHSEVVNFTIPSDKEVHPKVYQMRYLKSFNESKQSDKFDVIKDSLGYHCKFKCSGGTGRALLFSSERKLRNLDLGEGEMFLFGIETTPNNSGIGRIFLNKIFDYFKLNKLYLPSSEDHPVWNKIATKTDKIITMGSNDSVIYTLTKNQLNKV